MIEWLDIVYTGGASLIWIGSARQILKTLRRKCSDDVSMTLMTTVFLAHALMMPKALTSGVPVWMLCHGISLTIAGIVLVLIIKYRRNESRLPTDIKKLVDSVSRANAACLTRIKAAKKEEN